MSTTFSANDFRLADTMEILEANPRRDWVGNHVTADLIEIEHLELPGRIQLLATHDELVVTLHVPVEAFDGYRPIAGARFTGQHVEVAAAITICTYLDHMEG